MTAPGETFSHYRIIRPLGRGGMGEVFLARDEHLDRKVALKFLAGADEHNAALRQRFLREAKAAARLDHPFICKVYEAGEIDGRLFIAMEYVEGETLGARLESGALDPEEVSQIALEIAEALEVAHDHGIVHRDLKPSNVMLTAHHAKVMDFGLAKFVIGGEGDSREATMSREDLTQQGAAIGTLLYMSPEQAQGLPVGARSDIFSFGIVLHEMLAGEHPFRRDSAAATVSAILRDDPPEVHSGAGRLPAAFEAILHRALAKEPGDRYQSARRLTEDLRALRQSHVGTDPRGLGRPAIRIGALLGVVAVVALVAWWLAVGRRAESPPGSVPSSMSVLVADFENETADAVFDGVLEQAAVIGLEAAPFVSAYSRTRAREVARELAGAERALDTETARLVARREGIEVVVSGAIAPADEGYRIQVSALDGVEGTLLAAHERNASGKDLVLAALGEVIVETRRDLGDVIPDSVQAVARETFTAASLEAARSYTRAQALMETGKWQEAIPVYQSALQLDPAFGRAYAGLAVCHLNLNQIEEAREYYEKAFAHIDRMTAREKHRTRGGYYLLVRNYTRAAEEYRALAEGYPSDPAGLTNLAFAYFFARDMSRAVETGRRAAEAHPDAILARANLALYAMYAGDFETAAREAEAVLDQNPSYETAYVPLALARLETGDIEGARTVYGRLQGVSTYGASLAATGLADVELYSGRTAEAVAILEKGIAGDLATGLEAEAARKHFMVAHAALSEGDLEGAAAAAERSLALSQRHYVLLAAGRVLAASGRGQRAQELAERLASRTEPEPRAFARLLSGEVLLQRGEARQAVTEAQDSLGILDTWLGRELLGRAYLEAGAYTEAHAELETALERRGEATAVFLDDVPSYYRLPPLHYFLGRALEGLGSSGAAGSYRRFLALRPPDGGNALAAEARRRLEALTPQGSD
jgi:tetratricopeptide (TPR) repeat protein/predicted Ser/Thr protein kinase